MSIIDDFERQLGNVLQLAAAGPYVVQLPVPGGEMQCALAAVDSIGCAVDYVRLSFEDPRRWPIDKLRTLADQLCKQLRYLVEPLQVIEVYQDEPLVQARSQPPTQDVHRNVSYYELLVTPQSLSLVRFSAPRGEPRRTVPMQLTREVLRRLVQDITAAL